MPWTCSTRICSRPREALQIGRAPGLEPAQARGGPADRRPERRPVLPVALAGLRPLPFWQSLEWIAFLKLLVAGAARSVLLRRLGVGGAGRCWPPCPSLRVRRPVRGLARASPGGGVRVDAVAAGRRRLAGARAGRHARGALACGGLAGVAQLAGHPESTLVLISAFLAFVVYLAATRAPPRRLRHLALQIAGVGGIASLGGRGHPDPHPGHAGRLGRPPPRDARPAAAAPPAGRVLSRGVGPARQVLAAGPLGHQLRLPVHVHRGGAAGAGRRRPGGPARARPAVLPRSWPRSAGSWCSGCRWSRTWSTPCRCSRWPTSGTSSSWPCSADRCWPATGSMPRCGGMRCSAAAS